MSDDKNCTPSRVNIKFSLRNNVDFWEKHLKSSQFVLNILRHGYVLPFSTRPPKCCEKNNASSLKHKAFVTDAINDLLKAGFVTELSQPAHCCNPLTVADKGKLRLVLDLRQVNKYLILKKFRYEYLRTVAELIEPNDYFVRFDLSSGYHHIDIHPEYHKYLGFHWEFTEGIIRYFQFTVLCFGISTACYLFTKVMRPLTKHWRGKGIKCVIYIDDGIGAMKGKDAAQKAGEQMKEVLEKTGFHINKEKSCFEPTQRGKWLGTVIDTQSMTFQVPSEKLEKLKKYIKNILEKGCATAKELSSIAGTLSSMHLAIGPLVRLFTRNIYHHIEKSPSWYNTVNLSRETTNDLTFWLNNIEDVNGFTFKHRPTTTRIMFTDASESGYGGFTVDRLGQMICAGKFTPHESHLSSTYRELLAVKLVLQSYGAILTNQAIQINIDNFNATRILTIGSSKPHLQRLAIEIFNYCLSYNIKLIPEWTPRELNRCADYYSKIKDTDSWGIDRETFEFINSQYGDFTVDRFADDRNKKLPTFNSRYYCPGTSHVNTFTANWSGENNWLSPPISLIGSAIRHLKLCKGVGTLLVPVWESSYYWPIIFPNGLHAAEFVKGILIIEPYYQSYSENDVFNGFVNFKTMAIKLQF